MSFQQSGFGKFQDAVENLATVVGNEASLGDSLANLMWSSAVGVVGLDLLVVVHGLVTWCERIDRKEARKGGNGCCGLRARRMARPNKCSCARCLLRAMSCCAHTGFHFVLIFFVTPLLWALIVIQVLLSILSACFICLFFAAYQSCTKMVSSMTDSINF